MLTVNINQVKTHLSRYLNLIQKGKKVIIARRNVPVAEIKPIMTDYPRRKIGQCEENLEIPRSFFESLPKQIIQVFNKPK